MQIDFSLLDKLAAKDAPGEPNNKREATRGQIDTQEQKSPGNGREKPQGQEATREAVQEIIIDLTDSYKIDNYIQENVIYSKEKEPEAKEDFKYLIARLKREHSTEPPGSPGEPGKQTDDKKDNRDGKGENKATEKPTEYSNKMLVKLEREQKAIERANIIYKEYQDNIKKSETLRTEIITDLREKAAPQEIIKKAVECISLMTGDKYYYNAALKILEESQ